MEYQSTEIKTRMHNWSVTNSSGYVSSLFECRISVESKVIFVDKVDWCVPHFINVGNNHSRVEFVTCVITESA